MKKLWNENRKRYKFCKKYIYKRSWKNERICELFNKYKQMKHKWFKLLSFEHFFTFNDDVFHFIIMYVPHTFLSRIIIFKIAGRNILSTNCVISNNFCIYALSPIGSSITLNVAELL